MVSAVQHRAQETKSGQFIGAITADSVAKTKVAIAEFFNALNVRAYKVEVKNPRSSEKNFLTYLKAVNEKANNILKILESKSDSKSAGEMHFDLSTQQITCNSQVIFRYDIEDVACDMRNLIAVLFSTKKPSRAVISNLIDVYNFFAVLSARLNAVKLNYEEQKSAIEQQVLEQPNRQLAELKGENQRLCDLIQKQKAEIEKEKKDREAVAQELKELREKVKNAEEEYKQEFDRAHDRAVEVEQKARLNLEVQLTASDQKAKSIEEQLAEAKRLICTLDAELTRLKEKAEKYDKLCENLAPKGKSSKLQKAFVKHASGVEILVDEYFTGNHWASIGKTLCGLGTSGAGYFLLAGPPGWTIFGIGLFFAALNIYQIWSDEHYRGKFNAANRQMDIDFFAVSRLFDAEEKLDSTHANGISQQLAPSDVKRGRAWSCSNILAPLLQSAITPAAQPSGEEKIDGERKKPGRQLSRSRSSPLLSISFQKPKAADLKRQPDEKKILDGGIGVILKGTQRNN